MGRDNADGYIANPIPGSEPCKTDCLGSPPYCGDNEPHENEECDEGEGNDNLLVLLVNELIFLLSSSALVGSGAQRVVVFYEQPPS